MCLCYAQLVIEVLPVDNRRAARYDEGPFLEVPIQEAALISLLSLRDPVSSCDVSDLKFGRIHGCWQNLKTLRCNETKAARDSVTINRKRATAELTMRIVFWALEFIDLRAIDMWQNAIPGELLCRKYNTSPC